MVQNILVVACGVLLADVIKLLLDLLIDRFADDKDDR